MGEWLLLVGGIALAGAIGTLARFGVANVSFRFLGGDFPWGTLVVNLLGCFLFGLVWALAEDQAVIGANARLMLLTGFMGAFTTFSTFAFDTNALLLRAALWASLANVAAQVIGGLVALAVGMALGRAVA